LGLIAFSPTLIVVTTVYQRIATANERSRFPFPGRLVDVGGYRLHLRCEGEGSPTVVVESGGGMTSNEWTLVQPEVAKFTRICSYDRTGLGWSENGPVEDPVQVLHVLLRNAGVAGPYAMVGHSYGSGLVRRFAFRFPCEVKGMVLTASSYPDEEVQRIAVRRVGSGLYFKIYDWSTRLGLMRITSERYLPEMLHVYFGLLRQYLPLKAAECEISFLHQIRHVHSFIIESRRPTPEEEIEDVAACKRGFANMPLVVLSEKWIYSATASEPEKEEARREDERQTRLARLSSRGQKIDLESGHLIPLENPSAVVDAVRQVVLIARATQ
jgi:pimeloyl-ACP methyl ester carboxylesterase